MSEAPRVALAVSRERAADRAPRVALLAAGGTGGHLFPAEALAGELRQRGFVVDLATDERGDRYGFRFPASNVHIVPADTVRSKNPLALAKTALTLGRGILVALRVIGRVKPVVVVGFGGYPSFPPLMAASLRQVPSVLHEQNAVMGRANRRLAGRVTAVALSWSRTLYADGPIALKARHVGVPVRAPVIAAASIPYDMPGADSALELLVFGGSQGARVFADLVPPALAALSPALRARLRLTQQVREEDLSRVSAAYEAQDVTASLAPFFQNLPARIAGSHLVLARSGASTVAELAVIGRPAILVPLPHAIDHDQLRNAEALANAGGAIIAEQAALTPEKLAQLLNETLSDPARLARMAAAARTVGIPDAVKRLADLVEEVAEQAA